MAALPETLQISSRAARDFLWQFRLHREANREFYRSVPAERYDERLVDPKSRRTDSTRESLLHQLFVVRNYVHSAKTGVLHWGPERERLLMAPALRHWDKRRLMEELDRSEQELVEVLASPDIDARKVRVGWQEAPLPAVRVLQSLIDHEILQASFNQALAAYLQVGRYPALSRL